MESLPMVITVLSLLIAGAASLVAWRTARDERRRAAARVAALSVAALGSGAEAAEGPRRKAEGARQKPGAIVQESDERPVVGGADPAPSSGSRQRALAVAAATLFVGLAGALLWTVLQPRAGVAPEAQAAAPLELLSLAHARQASTLAVSGLVRNPAAAHPLARLSAVVFLFDQSGTLVGSGRAPVDFTMLSAGDESPFVVALDAPASVARYRVSFRTDDGLVPHVDRRPAPALSASAEQAVNAEVK